MIGTGSFTNRLDFVATAIVEAMIGSQPPDPELLEALTDELMIRARGRGRSSPDVEDAVQASILAFFEAIDQGRVEAPRAGAYVAAILRYRLVDLHRRATTVAGLRREVLFGDPADVARYAEDDALARLLDEDAARSDVVDGQRRALRDGRGTVVRVVSEWLVVAERSGREPSSREVARRMGVSHTTVVEAIGEFREKYLPRRGSRA